MLGQIGLFPTHVEKKPTVNQYWLAKSALQKMIRRGFVDEAIEMGRLVYLHNKSALRQRLLVILYEDIGMGDVDLTLDLSKRIARGRLSWEDYRVIIERQCRALKSRDCDDGLWFVGTEQFKTNEAQALNRIWEQEIVPTSNAHREALQAVQSIAHLDQGQAKLFKYWLSVRAEPWVPPTSVSEEQELLKFDWIDCGSIRIPDIAVDGHTRAGKWAFNIISKKLSLSYDEVHGSFFNNEGAILDKRAVWEFDYRGYYQGEPLVKREDVLELRAWAVQKCEEA